MFSNLTRGLALAALLAVPAAAHDYKAGDLAIAHPAIPQPLTRAMSAGGFFAVTNTGLQADRLIGVEVDFAERAEVHITEHGTDGSAKMVHVEAIDLPPGETVTFERGGYHVMFMGLKSGLEAGAKLPGTLVFEKAGRVAVDFAVEAPKKPEPGAKGKDPHAHH
ncbi:copper chaperone PCu(A)C [Falsigemmobacter faecalis]|uniref:Copper chaperone PCu(A)C n=1 Tax=Falsigemmobacter faecalis TaxID=2488730 RepID=A0A3P3DT05_9RHOB|nr:copper chaperone PCu(A)C [Falsigemmobacter faecalis]RRH77295.1 copper chaperone PCu(A)C [Falsigemmobacter faecalis]